MAARSDVELLTEHFGYPPVVRIDISALQFSPLPKVNKTQLTTLILNRAY